MKHQALLSWKDKSKKLKCPLLQFLFVALRVKVPKKQVTKFNSKFQESFIMLKIQRL